MKRTVAILYQCKGGCHEGERTVQVPARGTEDVKTWMDTALLPALGRDHASRSPLCTAREMQHVKIPINTTGDARIGAPVERTVQ